MKRLLPLLATLSICLTSHAHRLDEYLQATRVAVSLTQIDLSIDLTPGVSVAPKLLGVIDPSNHEVVPARKAKAYALRVLRDLELELDGKRYALKLGSQTFPTRAEMQEGEGIIRLRASTKVPELRVGAHELMLRNHHLPDISVYLANALAPESGAIQITRQARDERQQQYQVSFEVKAP